MLNLLCFLCCSLLLATITNAENYEEDSEGDDDTTASLEPESNEVFNNSSKEKPHRLLSNNNIIINVSTCTDNMKTSMKHFPFAVSIQKRGSHYATGALIDKRWILTAAGPFYNVRESIKLLKARLGSVNCKKGGRVLPLKEIIIHPSYTHVGPMYDLALLMIGQPLKFSEFISPISVASIKGRILSATFESTYWSRLINGTILLYKNLNSEANGSRSTCTWIIPIQAQFDLLPKAKLPNMIILSKFVLEMTWITINEKLLPITAKERIYPNSLRVSIQDMLPLEQCAEALKRSNYTLNPSTLCLRPIVSHHSPCMPDVGAPITIGDRLWGITSGWTSLDCLENISPTVFNTIFASTEKWIGSTLHIA